MTTGSLETLSKRKRARLARRGEIAADDRGRLIAIDLAGVAGTIKQMGRRSWTMTTINVAAALFGVFIVYKIATNPAGLIPKFDVATALFWSAWLAFNFFVSRVVRAYPAPLPPSSAALLSLDRCGGCGYQLATVPVSADGMRQCPECGGAWHPDRTVFPPDDALRAQLVLARLNSAAQTRFVGATDDRGVPLKDYYQWPPSSLRWAPPLSHPGVASLQTAVGKRSRIAAAVLSVIWAVAITLWVILSDPQDRATVLVIVVTGIILGVLILVAWRWPLSPSEVRRRLLATSNCPSCWKQFRSEPVQFDGCVVCQGCLASWKAADIGPTPDANGGFFSPLADRGATALERDSA